MKPPRLTRPFLLLLAVGCLPAMGDEIPPSAVTGRETGRKVDGSNPQRGGLSLLELVQIALTRNPQTRMAWAQAREAMAEVGIAKSFYYPEVTLSGELEIYDQREADYPGYKDITNYFNGGPQIDIYYLLLDFGGRDAYVAMMREQLTAAKFNQNQVMQDVILAVQTAYFQAMASESLVIVAEAQVEAARINFASQQLAQEVGLADPTQVLEAETAMQAANASLQQAQSARATAYGNVNVACGAPANAPLQLAVMPAQLRVEEVENNIDQLVTSAFARRPELSERLAMVRAKEEAVRRAQSQYWPEVSFEGEWYMSWYRSRTRVDGLPPTFNESNHEYLAGGAIVLEWEIFDGGRRTNQVRAARAEVEQAKAELAQSKLDVSQQVWNAYFDYLIAGRFLEYRRAGVRSATLQFEQTREGLAAGLNDLNDFSQIEVVLAQAEADLATAEAQWYTSAAALIYASGRLTPGAVPRAASAP